MERIGMSRRALLRAGGLTLAGVGLLRASNTFAWGSASAESGTDSGVPEEQLIKTYYSGWERKDWNVIDGVLADGFTFTSPNNDDHIDKRAFKKRCWAQADFIDRFQLESVVAKGDQAFVKYLCHTKNGKSFRNIEFFRFSDGKILAIECYFGDALGFPSAASTGQR